MTTLPGLRFGAWLERARESFWPVPLAAVVAAVVVGATLPRVELRTASFQMPWLFDGGPDAARSVLSAIAGSMITVTSLTFSLTVITLQLASSQFSPRLLRSFLRDLRNQAVLALLLATFLFSLMVLLTVRTQNDRGPGFVPELSVSIALLMVLTSVAALVWFIGHVVAVVRVGRIMADVAAESVGLLQSDSPTDDRVAIGDPSAPEPHGEPLRVERSGFVQAIDTEAVCRWATAQDVVVHLAAEPGTWLVRGTPWAFVEGSTSGGLPSALTLGPERTAQQDVGFGIRQLVDIALRALSPGINDPTTAIDAIGHVGDILVVMSACPLGAETRRDENGTARVHVARPTFADHLALACGQIRRSGAALPEVATALIDTLGAVGGSIEGGERRAAVLTELADVVAAVEEQDWSVRDLHDVRARISAARSLLELPAD